MAKEIFSVYDSQGSLVIAEVSLAAARKEANRLAKAHLVKFVVKNEKGKAVYVVRTELVSTGA